uniref:Immunoglobulin V-set domain-containing protein n=1 Tax=Echeneis naucrates TaxID=173247 RepID=A0A665V446_ECHNA
RRSLRSSQSSVKRTSVRLDVEHQLLSPGDLNLTTDSFPNLFWYKQEANSFPQYMLRCSAKNVDKAPELDQKRFHAEIKNKSVPLKIQKLQVSDSAVYYCALRPTVTGNNTTLYKNLWSKDNTILHNIH